jgi:hypothetical protein
MAVQFVFPGQQRVDANGNPYAGATLEFFEPGTSDPKDVYSDDTLETAIEQPVEADAGGVWDRMFLSGKYKVILKNSSGSTLNTWDDYDPGLSTALGTSEALPIEAGGTNATTAASARNNLGAASQSQVSEIQTTVSENDALIATGLHTDGDRFGTAATKDTGTSGANVPLLNGNNTHSGTNTFSDTGGVSTRNTAKAFAMFTQSSTTVSYNASTQGFNIASITRTGVGTYTVSFTNALPTANFSVSISGKVKGFSFPIGGYVTSKATSGFTLNLFEQNADVSAAEPDTCDIIVFGY